MQKHASSCFVRFTVLSLVVIGGFFYTQGVWAQAQRPDLRITKAAFDGLNLHVEYVNATGVGYPRVRYEVGFQWYDASGSAVGTRHWLPVPEVERGGVAILDNKYRIDLTYRGRDGRNYGRTLAEFLYQRPNQAEELRVMVDDGDRVSETDESNNIARLRIPLPDLQITGAKFLSPNKLELSYRNANPSPIRLSFRIGFTWAEEGGAYANATRWINVLEPAAGATETVVLSRTDASYITASGRQAGDRLDWYFERRPGNATRLKITIDDAGTVREQNEQNNLVTARPFLPDLVVRDAKLEGGRLTFTYGNAGEGGMRDSASRVLFQWRNAAGQPVGTPRWYRFAQMNPKQLFPVKAERFDVEYAVTGTNRTSTQRIDAYLREQPPDAVRLTITVDDEQRISEADETNNTETVTPAPLPKPDLTVEAITIDADGQPHATVWNRGEGRADSVVVSHEYRDRAGKPLGGDSRETAPLGLGADQKITDAILGTIPDTAVTVAITVDPKNAVTETDEQNNAKEAPAPMADLLVVEAKPDANGSLALTYRNVGNRKADPLSIWVHFADAQGAQIGPLYWMDVSPIRAGGTQVLANETVFAMSSAGQVELRALFEQPPAGATQVKVLLDGPDRVVESNEGNNVALLPIPVVARPDFTITDPRVDADGTIHFTVRNIGTAGVTSLRVRGQWVQADGEIIIGGDRIFSMSAVGVGFVSEQVAQSILPDIFPAPDAAAKLRLIADPIGRLGELNEENNILEIALPPRVPDLAIADLVLTADQATWRMRNIGDPLPPTQALTFVVEFQWLDQTGAPIGPSAGINSDIYFPTPTYVHNRSTGYSGSASSDYILRRPAGAARIRVTEDSTNVIREKDETNNVAEATVPLPPPPPQPDLMFARTALIADAPDPRIDYVLKNAGTADTTGGVLELQWLTADGKPTGPTHAFVTYGLLKPGDRATRGLLMQDSGPKPGQTGRYLLLPPEDATHLRLTLDPENAIAESDETNNVAVLVRPPAIPLSDLTATAAKLALDAFALTYQNAGSVRAGLGAPLSTWFEWVDASDGRVGELVWHDGETLPPKYRTQIEGETKVSSASRSNLPLREFLAAPPDGATHLKVSLDGPNALLESNEANNVTRLVRQTVPLPDLRISIFSMDPIAPRAGERVWFIVRVENVGRAATGTQTATGIIVDPEKSGTYRKLIGQFTAPDIAPGKFFTHRWTKENYYGWVAVAGTHTFEVCADRAKVVPEEDEINNCAKKEVAVAATVDEQSKLPDLTIMNATLDTAALRFWYHNLGETATASSGISLWYELVDTQGRRVSALRWINVNAVMPAKSKQQGNQLLEFADLDSERGKITLGDFVNSAPPSATHLKLTIDGPNAHAEANEQNNSVLLPLPKPAALNLPDLALTAGVRAGGVVRVTIVNGTPGELSAPQLQFKWLDKNDKEIWKSPMSFWQHEVIPAGKTGDFTIEYEKWREDGVIYFLKHPPAGTVALLATIDPENKLKESNEDNNAFRIALGQTGAAQLPDLAFTGIFVPSGSDRLVIGFENAGKAEAPVWEWQIRWLDVKDQPVGETYRGTHPGLKAGWRYGVGNDSQDLTGKPRPLGEFLRQIPTGATRIEITIDPDNKVMEANESNNRQYFEIASFPPSLLTPKASTPALTLSLAVEIVKAKTAAASSSATAGFLLALGALLVGGFMIHAHSGAPKGIWGALQTFPWLLTSPSASYMRLNSCGPEGCAGRHFERHKTLKRLTRASLVVAALTGAAKIGLAFAIASVAGPTPSLQAQVLEARVGEDLRATLTAKNTGAARAEGIILKLPCPDGTAWKSTQLNRRSTGKNADQDVGAPDLEKGAAHTLAITCAVQENALAKGTLSFSGVARAKGALNPFISNAVEVKVAAQPEPPKPPEPKGPPDLSVLGVGLLAEDVVSGDNLPFTVTFTAIVENKGASRAPAATSRLRIDVGADGSYDITVPGTVPPPEDGTEIAADGRANAQWSVKWRAPLGSYAFEICVDTDNAIAESNEENNCAKDNFELKVGQEPIFEEG